MQYWYHAIQQRFIIKILPVKIKQFLFALLFSYSGIFLYGQNGGQNSYEFMRIAHSARIASIGGKAPAVKDHDVAVGLMNPSLITDSMHNKLSLSYVDYYSDINYGVVGYSRSFPRFGSYAAGFQFINYGSFVEREENEEEIGTFNPGEYAFIMGWGRNLTPTLSMGANLKTVYSDMYKVNSLGLLVDIAGSYHNPDKRFTASLLFQNIGREIKSYYKGNPNPMPFEIQAGISKRAEHVPFRYFVVLQNLEKWDLTYNEPEEDVFLNEDPNMMPEEETKLQKITDDVAEFGDKAMRHVIVGGEFYIGKSLSFRAGYNYKRRQELLVDSRTAMVGFSWGFQVKISRFYLSYARSAYHLAGSPNYISLSTNLSDFFN